MAYYTDYESDSYDGICSETISESLSEDERSLDEKEDSFPFNGTNYQEAVSQIDQEIPSVMQYHNGSAYIHYQKQGVYYPSQPFGNEGDDNPESEPPCGSCQPSNYSNISHCEEFNADSEDDDYELETDKIQTHITDRFSLSDNYVTPASFADYRDKHARIRPTCDRSFKENSWPGRVPYLLSQPASTFPEFHTRCTFTNGKIGNVFINPDLPNLASTYLVEKLQLPLIDHPNPYRIQGLSAAGDFYISKKVHVTFSIGKRYFDSVICDVVDFKYFHVLLGRDWFMHRDARFEEDQQICSLVANKRRICLVNLNCSLEKEAMVSNHEAMTASGQDEPKSATEHISATSAEFNPSATVPSSCPYPFEAPRQAELCTKSDDAEASQPLDTLRTSNRLFHFQVGSMIIYAQAEEEPAPERSKELTVIVEIPATNRVEDTRGSNDADNESSPAQHEEQYHLAPSMVIPHPQVEELSASFNKWNNPLFSNHDSFIYKSWSNPLFEWNIGDLTFSLDAVETLADHHGTASNGEGHLGVKRPSPDQNVKDLAHSSNTGFFLPLLKLEQTVCEHVPDVQSHPWENMCRFPCQGWSSCLLYSCLQQEEHATPRSTLHKYFQHDYRCLRELSCQWHEARWQTSMGEIPICVLKDGFYKFFHLNGD